MANLWIRSQARTVLQKTDCVIYRYTNDKHTISIINGNNYVLGEYSTKERCFEIIDEIQKLLLSANPENAFVVLKNLEMDYEETKFYIERARRDNFLNYHSGYDSSGEKGSIQFLQPNVLVYEMPEE